MTNTIKTTSHQQQTYTFLDYEVHPNLREIHQIKTQIKMGKKSFDILLLLIEKQGQVVTKQELIEQVWPNQIVTDAALNKQITRLRNDLAINKTTEQPIIETVRGVGIMLVPPVNLVVKKPDSNKLKWLLLILATIIALYLYLQNNKQNIVNTANQSKQTNIPVSLNVAVVPSTQSSDWFNVGGLNYISEQLQNHPQIQSIKPNLKWFSQDNSKHLVIEITQREGIDYVLSINNYQKDKLFYSKVILRNSSEILARQTISASSLSALFTSLNSWTIRQLENSSKIVKGNVFGYKPTEYALESYIKGLDVAKNDRFDKAVGLLNAAVNDDPGFFSAWILLAEVELQLGNYNKASAIVDTIEASDDFDKTMLNDLYNIKALSMFYLNNLAESKKAAEIAEKLSETKRDYLALIKALVTQAMIDFNSKNLGEHTIEKMKRVANLTKKYNPTPYSIAKTNLQLASTYQAVGNPEPAIQHISIALEMFKKENNIKEIVSSSSIMTRIYNELANPAKAIQVVESYKNYYQQIDAYLLQIRFLNNKSEAQMYFGLRKQAQKSINELKDLSLTNTGNEAKVVALILQVDLDILYKDYNAAKTPVQQLLQIIKAQPESFPPLYKQMINIYSLLVDSLNEPHKDVRIKLTQQLNLDEDLQSSYEMELYIIEAHLLRKEGFTSEAIKKYRQAMQGYIEVNNIRYALYAGYNILDIQWKYNLNDYMKTMNYLDEISTFKYPIHKYKAQYLAYKKDYINAYIMMTDLKSKANEFWTANDQILLEEYQQLAQK